MSGARKIGVNATSLFHIEISLNTKPTSKIKILHVDDDPSLQEITKLMLLDLDSSFQIDCACCVDEAFKKQATGGRERGNTLQTNNKSASKQLGKA